MTKLRSLGWLFFSLACAALAIDSARNTASAGIASSGTIEDVSKAIAIWPHRAEFYRNMAVLDPEQSAAWFGKALALNPNDPRSYLRAGLQAEGEGDYAAAERYLVESTRVDRTFEPVWTLCNYYFRRGNEEKFRQWAAEAGRIGRADLTPLFDLAWRQHPDAAVIIKTIAPPGCTHGHALFEYLRAVDAPDEQVALASTALTGCQDSPSRVSLARYATSLIFDGHPQEALHVWNGLVPGKDLPFATVDPARGKVLTNGNLTVFPTRLGFDWHYDPVPGLTLSKTRGAGGLDLQFDGTEPQAVGVLYQPLVLAAATQYQLRSEMSMRGGPMVEGFHWRLADMTTGATVGTPSEDLQGPGGTRTWRFESSNRPLYALVLLYQRPAGSTLFQGAFELSKVELAPIAKP